ncbi:MAG: hypothetical protein ABSB18_05875 [Candidatus Omnitrophota bacterium]
MKKRAILSFIGVFLVLLFALPRLCPASELDQQLSQTGQVYIKYFKDHAQSVPSGFGGLTNSFLIDLGGHSDADKAAIDHGGASYDQSILARVELAGNTTTILDTYLNYATPAKLTDAGNPLLNCSGLFYGAGGESDPILYGPYRLVRISGRGIDDGDWWDQWDWIVDTGAAACLITDALEAYQKTANVAYKDFAILLGGYILKLKDTDGGIRYGPRGMYHDPESKSDFYWNLKSTEQNERCLYAFQALYSVTNNAQYDAAATGIKTWLKSMYNSSSHLFHASAIYEGGAWVKSDINGYVPTDVTAFAPLDMMFNDNFFGATPALRDAEVDAMFAAIESKTAFLNAQGKPEFFRFSVSQTGDYGSVEWSAQMALAYLRAAQNYSTRDLNKAAPYVYKYHTLINSLENYFSAPVDDPDSKVAPYGSNYPAKTVAGHVPTGTGYDTFNCQAALASCYYAFARSGYDPTKLGGGIGIPAILNLSDVPSYDTISPYFSTGAAVAHMILNYMRAGTGLPPLDQNAIYEYAKTIPYGSDKLNPDEVDKALGHFDPYDTLISNWSNGYDSLADGNPYKGYNFGVDSYDPNSDPQAINKYICDICHWMAYTVTKEDWWRDGELVAHPNTPAAIPIYGTYSHWVVVKGFAASDDPCPSPHTNPWNTPDFTVYGFWMKDPLSGGIGQETYKTTAECISTYFRPLLSTGDNYNGKFVQVSEPPPYPSKAEIKIPQPTQDMANLEFIGVKTNSENNPTTLKALSLSMLSGSSNEAPVVKKDWRDILPAPLLSDPECQKAFTATIRGRPLLVKRTDTEGSGYYLLPFNKRDKRGRLLTSAVIILDANAGYFKEASWTEVPEKFLKVGNKEAVELITNYLLKDLSVKLNKLRRTPYNAYLKQRDILIKDYRKLLGYLRGAKLELLWSSGTSYSLSPYEPYWKIDANGYIWYVMQTGEIIPQTAMDKVLNEIQTNRLALQKL